MRVFVSDHAVARYVERVKPSADHARARAELIDLVARAGDPVPFISYCSEPFHAFLELSDGIALALNADPDRLIGVTVVVRGGSNEMARRQAKAEKRKRRQAEQIKRSRERYFDRKARRDARSTSGPGWPE